MRLTLEELRAMSDERLGWQWASGGWPFENMPGCQRCLVHHSRAWMGENGCKQHPGITAQATQLLPKLILGEERVAFIREHLEEFIALRLFYDSLYPPVPAAEPVVINQAVAEAEVRT